MSRIAKVSEAAAIGLHAIIILATPPQARWTTLQIAQALQVSEAHLAKVLQRLHRAGLVESSRGPGGGFVLAVDPDTTTLLQVYEAIEGRLQTASCLFEQPVCTGGNCILGNLFGQINDLIRQALEPTTLTQVLQRCRQSSAVAHGEHSA